MAEQETAGQMKRTGTNAQAVETRTGDLGRVQRLYSVLQELGEEGQGKTGTDPGNGHKG